MKITSKFTTGMIARIVKGALRKKLRCDIDIQINELRASIDDGKTHVHLDVDANLEKEALFKLLLMAGLQ